MRLIPAGIGRRELRNENHGIELPVTCLAWQSASAAYGNLSISGEAGLRFSSFTSFNFGWPLQRGVTGSTSTIAAIASLANFAGPGSARIQDDAALATDGTGANGVAWTWGFAKSRRSPKGGGHSRNHSPWCHRSSPINAFEIQTSLRSRKTAQCRQLIQRNCLTILARKLSGMPKPRLPGITSNDSPACRLPGSCTAR